MKLEYAIDQFSGFKLYVINNSRFPFFTLRVLLSEADNNKFGRHIHFNTSNIKVELFQNNVKLFRNCYRINLNMSKSIFFYTILRPSNILLGKLSIDFSFG